MVVVTAAAAVMAVEADPMVETVGQGMVEMVETEMVVTEMEKEKKEMIS